MTLPPRARTFGPSRFWVLSTLAIALSLVGVLALHFSVVGGPPRAVTVPSVEWTVQYSGSAAGYLGASPLNGCLPCPMAGNPGGAYTVDLYVVNNGTAPHTLLNVTVDPPFQEYPAYPTIPSVPLLLHPGEGALVSVSILYPSTPGAYPLTGSVVTQ